MRIVVWPDLPLMHWAAERGAVGVIRALLGRDNVDLSPVYGMSPTIMAAESISLERHPKLVETIVEMFLSAGGGYEICIFLIISPSRDFLTI